MSLLNPEPVEPTLEEKQAQVADRIKRMAATGFRQLSQIQAQGIQTVWNNPRGLTPQQVCDALGTDAGLIFQMHGQLTDAAVAMATADGLEYTPALPTNAFTVNEDGTVTVLETEYVPS